MDAKEPGRAGTSAQMERILYEVKKIVVGQDHFLERVLVAILAQGHLLVEGVPGLAKTLTVKTLARTIRGSFRRIQFTPDLVPADLVGTTEELSALQQECRKGYIDPALIQYAVRLASATRQPERFGAKGLSRYISFGASPRGSIHLIEAARALAFLRGRDYLLPEDVA